MMRPTPLMLLLPLLSLALPAQAQLPCDGQSSEAAIAAALAMPTERLQRLKSKHQFDNGTLCALTPARFLKLNFNLDAPAPALVEAAFEYQDRVRQADYYGLVDPQRLAEANRQRQRNLARIDPNHPSQQWSALPLGTVGGRFEKVLTLAAVPGACLAGAPAAGFRLVAGTAQAGVFYSDDGGTTWQPARPDNASPYYVMGNVAINSLAVTDQSGCTLRASGGQIAWRTGSVIGGSNIGLIDSTDAQVWGGGISAAVDRVWTDLTPSDGGWYAAQHALAWGSHQLVRLDAGAWQAQSLGLSGCRLTGGGNYTINQKIRAYYLNQCGELLFPDSGVALVVGATAAVPARWLRAVAGISGTRLHLAAWTLDGALQVWRCDNCLDSQGTPQAGTWQQVTVLENSDFSTEAATALALWVQPDDPEHVVVAGRKIWRQTAASQRTGTPFFMIGDGELAPYFPLGQTIPAYSAPRGVNRMLGVAKRSNMNQPLARLHDCQGESDCRYELWLAADEGIYHIDIAATSAARALGLGDWQKVAVTSTASYAVAGYRLDAKHALIGISIAGGSSGNGGIQSAVLDLTNQSLVAGNTQPLADGNGGLVWLLPASAATRAALGPTALFAGGTAGFFTPFRKLLAPLAPGNPVLGNNLHLLPPDASIRSGLTADAMRADINVGALPPQVMVDDGDNPTLIVAGPDQHLWLGRGLNQLASENPAQAPGWVKLTGTALPAPPTALFAKAFGVTTFLLAATYNDTSKAQVCLYAWNPGTTKAAAVKCLPVNTASRINALTMSEHYDPATRQIDGTNSRIWFGTADNGLGYVSLNTLVAAVGSGEALELSVLLDKITVLNLAAHPKYSQWLYVGTGAGLKHFDGTNWTEIGTTTNARIQGLSWLAHSTSEDRLLLATDGGIWLSFDQAPPVRLQLVRNAATFALTATVNSTACALTLDFRTTESAAGPPIAWAWGEQQWGGSNTACPNIGTTQTLVGNLSWPDLCNRSSELSKVFQWSRIYINNVPYPLEADLAVLREGCV